MSKLGCPAAFTCPAAICHRPRFATNGCVSLGRSQSVVQRPGEPWCFIATADSQSFAADGARSLNVSAARHPCLAAIGDRKGFAAIGDQKRFFANGDRRRSTANSDRQGFGTISSRQELATACQ